MRKAPNPIGSGGKNGTLRGPSHAESARWLEYVPFWRTHSRSILLQGLAEAREQFSGRGSFSNELQKGLVIEGF
jgi:hypothetical protein